MEGFLAIQRREKRKLRNKRNFEIFMNLIYVSMIFIMITYLSKDFVDPIKKEQRSAISEYEQLFEPVEEKPSIVK